MTQERLSKLQVRILKALVELENEFRKKLKTAKDKYEIKKLSSLIRDGDGFSNLIYKMYGSEKIIAYRHLRYVGYKKDFLALQKSVYRSVANLNHKRLIIINYSDYSHRISGVKISSRGKAILDKEGRWALKTRTGKGFKSSSLNVS